MKGNLQKILVILLLAPLLAGCLKLGGESREPSRYYTLSSTLSEPLPLAAESVKTIGIGLIRLPAYVKRPQLVSIAHPHELRIHHTALWGEPLEDGFARVLALNLRQLRPADEILLFPWRARQPLDRQLSAEVLRLDVGPDDSARLIVHWQLLDAAGEVLVRQQKSYETAADPRDPASLAAAFSALLNEFSREVAAAMSAGAAP